MKNGCKKTFVLKNNYFANSVGGFGFLTSKTYSGKISNSQFFIGKSDICLNLKKMVPARVSYKSLTFKTNPKVNFTINLFSRTIQKIFQTCIFPIKATSFLVRSECFKNYFRRLIYVFFFLGKCEAHFYNSKISKLIITLIWYLNL